MKDRESLICKISQSLPYHIAVRAIFVIENAYYPNLRKPKTFNEKVCKLKINPPNLVCFLADKLNLRQYVEEKLSNEYLPDLYFCSHEMQIEDYNQLPESYVFKANHGWNFTKIVTRDDPTSFAELSTLSTNWLNQDFSRARNLERQYAKIKRKIYAEEYVGEAGKAANDYKLHVFRSSSTKVTEIFIEVHVDRFCDHRVQFLDRRWNPLGISLVGDQMIDNLPAPTSLQTMLKVAETLSSPFPYCRVDLYDHAGQVIVGEITFTPSGGHEKFEIISIDKNWGALAPAEFGRLFQN